MPSNKNVRLTFDAWSALRNLKFKLELPTYTDVFRQLFERTDGVMMKEHTSTKLPSDVDNTSIKKTDKTIVIHKDMHDKLIRYKNEYMQRTGATSRGKGSVSISDIVITLIRNFEER